MFVNSKDDKTVILDFVMNFDEIKFIIKSLQPWRLTIRRKAGEQARWDEPAIDTLNKLVSLEPLI